MDASVIAVAAVLIALVALLVAAVTDIKYRIISNRLAVAIVAGAVLYALSRAFAGHSFIDSFLYPLITSAGLFLLGFLLFAKGALGGGDVKLMAAFGLYLSPELGLGFLILTSLAGGILALVMLITQKVGVQIATRHSHTVTNHAKLPYGVAIMMAGWFICLSTLLGKGSGL